LTVDGRRWTGIAAFLLAISAANANAQFVRGVVLQRDSATKAPGVIVAASDTGGSVVGRALSNDDGDFDLRLPAAGKYTLRLLRVGFRPTVISALDVPESGVGGLRLVLGGEAVVLSAVTVRSENVCGSTDDAGRVVAQLWEEARTALTATELSVGAGSLRVEWQSFQYSMDRGGGRATEQSVITRAGATERPFVSVSADSLARFGYVVDAYDGFVTYSAPDAGALLSNQFAATHCFGVEPATRQRPHWVGVSFRPLPGRDRLRDIRGILWIDRATSELRLLEFRYTNLAQEADHELVGGFVEFARMASGHWLVARWAIRTPRMVVRVVGGGGVPGGGREERRVLASITVTGGELLSVRRQLEMLYRADPALVAAEGSTRTVSSQPSVCGATLRPGMTVYGTVANASRPAPGAVVSVAWTNDAGQQVALSSVVDSRGAFAMPCVARSVPLTVSAVLGDQRASPIAVPASAKNDLAVDIDFGTVATRRP
jgi:hypothetical protein